MRTCKDCVGKATVLGNVQSGRYKLENITDPVVRRWVKTGLRASRKAKVEALPRAEERKVDLVNFAIAAQNHEENGLNVLREAIDTMAKNGYVLDSVTSTEGGAGYEVTYRRKAVL